MRNMTANSFFSKIKHFLESEDRTEEQFAYILAAIFFLLFLIAAKFNWEYAAAFLAIATFFLSYGFFNFLLPILDRIWNSFIGKFLVSGLIFSGSTFTLSLAKTAINESFHVPASPFFHTQALLSILLAPVVISIILVIASIILLPILMPYFLSKNKTFSAKQLLVLWKKDGIIPENSFLSCLRISIYLLFIFILLSFITNSGWYIDTIMKPAKWYAYIFETEGFSYCKLNKNERVAYIGDDNIVVATEENGVISFKMAKCVNVNEK
jgi:hypothetical protein